jgi:2-polyprenyl-3-methyl-5-hydroxy-6-metoxy-1,4-benzoquinol methylase
MKYMALKVDFTGTHSFSKYIKPEEMVLMLESPKLNFSVAKINGMIVEFDIHNFPPMKWKLDSKDTDVNYIIHAVKK